MRVLHQPDEAEQGIIDDLLEQFRFEFVPVRLSKTMLEKSIIDARDPIRHLLIRAGIVDFAALGQGAEHKVEVPIQLFTKEGVRPRTMTFYRPHTKSGDPRAWISKLAREAVPGQLLLFVHAEGKLVALLLDGAAKVLAPQLGTIAPPRFEEQGEIERTVATLRGALSMLAGNWVPSLRPGDTGVGYTLETMLGIKANNSSLPDIGGVELKSYRRQRGTGSNKLITLFSKTPQWLAEWRPRDVVKQLGYYDEQEARQELNCTISTTRNTLGFSLNIETDASRVNLRHKTEDLAFYRFAILEERLRKKHRATLFVRASSRGAGRDEEFRFEEVTLCRDVSFTNFLELTAEDRVSLDFTMHLKPSGAVRDHGYLWRIRESAIPKLFAYRRQLLSA
jgi:hypothetical protein